MSLDNLEMATFKFIDCDTVIKFIGKDRQHYEYSIKGTYEQITIENKQGLLHALMKMKPKQIIRLS